MIITRFAPSPTGFLHLGHVASAMIAYDKAFKTSGRFLLRIEDIDQGRCRLEYEQAIMEDLTWLGIRWEGVVDRQSEYRALHEEALNRLARERMIYPCFCTRKDIEAAQSAPHGIEGAIYPGTCRGCPDTEIEAKLAAGENPAWRLDAMKAGQKLGRLFFFDENFGEQMVDPLLLGDVVLGRKDGSLSYHLCSVMDDARLGVNWITRGEDLLSSTHTHRLLQKLLDLPVPVYAHHALLLNEKGERLSKREQAFSIRAMRAAGYMPDEILSLAQNKLAAKA